jgi:hypothetical protein
MSAGWAEEIGGGFRIIAKHGTILVAYIKEAWESGKSIFPVPDTLLECAVL